MKPTWKFHRVWVTRKIHGGFIGAKTHEDGTSTVDQYARCCYLSSAASAYVSTDPGCWPSESNTISRCVEIIAILLDAGDRWRQSLRPCRVFHYWPVLLRVCALWARNHARVLYIQIIHEARNASCNICPYNNTVHAQYMFNIIFAHHMIQPQWRQHESVEAM